MFQGVRNLAKKIDDEKRKENILREIDDIFDEAKKAVSVKHHIMLYMLKNLPSSSSSLVPTPREAVLSSKDRSYMLSILALAGTSNVKSSLPSHGLQ